MKTRHPLPAMDKSRVNSPVSQLTDRELNILKLIGEGLDNPTIADQLDLTLDSVRAYRCNIKMMFSLRNTLAYTPVPHGI